MKAFKDVRVGNPFMQIRDGLVDERMVLLKDHPDDDPGAIDGSATPCRMARGPDGSFRLVPIAGSEKIRIGLERTVMVIPLVWPCYRVIGKRDFSCSDPDGGKKPFKHEFEAEHDEAAKAHLKELRGSGETWYEVNLIRIDIQEQGSTIPV